MADPLGPPNGAGYTIEPGMPFLPESPRWLARKDRWEESRHILARVHAKGDENHRFVTIEMQDIRETVEFERPGIQGLDCLYLSFRCVCNPLAFGIYPSHSAPTTTRSPFHSIISLINIARSLQPGDLPAGHIRRSYSRCASEERAWRSRHPATGFSTWP